MPLELHSRAAIHHEPRNRAGLIALVPRPVVVANLVRCRRLALSGAGVGCLDSLNSHDPAFQIANLPWGPFVARGTDRYAEREVSDHVFHARVILFRACLDKP